jgi:hypothetical protein
MDPKNRRFRTSAISPDKLPVWHRGYATGMVTNGHASRFAERAMEAFNNRRTKFGWSVEFIPGDHRQSGEACNGDAPEVGLETNAARGLIG